MKLIREWVLNDSENLAKVLNNIRVLDNLRDGIPYPYTENDAEEFIYSVLDSPKDSQYIWAVTDIDGTAIGSIGVIRQQNIHQYTAELGYYLDENFWGKGIMTEAVKQVCAYIFSDTDIIRIFAEPFSYNKASCRVLEKAGFTLEGTLRCNAVKNGIVLDMNIYALIRK